MKNNILLIFLVVLVATFGSCSNSFLDENNKPINGIELPHAITIPFESGINTIDIELNEFMEGMSYSIVAFPKSMTFDNLKGKIFNKKLSLLYHLDGVNYLELGVPVDVGSLIINIEELGLFKININTVYYGESYIKVIPEELDFGETSTSLILIIKNTAPGILNYNIHKMPDWIDIDEEQRKGRLYSHESTFVYINCNRENLEAGNYEGEIEIINEITNDFKIIPVKMIVPNTYLYPPMLVFNIEGVVTDAEFDKNSNTIYIATQNPNKVISYNIDTNSKKEILLDRNINCITLSDDNKQMFVGQSAKLTHIDATTFSVVNSYDLSFNVHDVVYDGANFCYMTYKASSTNLLKYITRINLLSGETNTYQFDVIYENTNLFKVKNSSQVLAARKTISPNGVILIEISSNEPNIVKYWHIGEGDRFWFSEDQKYMYTKNGKVFLRPTEQTQGNLSSLGVLITYGNDNYDFFPCNWIDHCANSKSIWASYNKRYSTANKNMVAEFDDMTYTRKTFMYLNDYQTTINGVEDNYPTNAFYIFANKNGDKITLIKNIDIEPTVNVWHLEIIDVLSNKYND